MANLLPALIEASRNQQESILKGSEAIGNFLRERRFNKLGKEFFSQGDYSPEGVMSFARKNNLSPAEMAGLVQTAGAFNHFKRGYDPLVQVSSTDDQGNQYVESVPESSTVGKKFMTKAGDTVPYYDLTTGEGGMFPSNQAPPPGWGTEGMLKSLMDQQGRMDATRYREDQANQRAAIRAQAQKESSGVGRNEQDQIDGKIKWLEKQRDFYAAKASFGDEAAARKADEYNAMIEKALGVQGQSGNNSTGNPMFDAFIRGMDRAKMAYEQQQTGNKSNADNGVFSVTPEQRDILKAMGGSTQQLIEAAKQTGTPPEVLLQRALDDYARQKR